MAAANLLEPKRKYLRYWIEQDTDTPGEWTDLVNEGHEVYHLIDPLSGRLGKVIIDDFIYTYGQAREAFLAR